MFSERIRKLMGRDALLTAGPGDTVSHAVQLMSGSEVGAVVVVEGQACIGIFTEHDAVARVMAAGRDPARTELRAVMSSPPVTITPERSLGQALQLMQSHGFHHLPVVDGGRPVGIVCSRDALDPELEEFTCEAQRREGFR